MATRSTNKLPLGIGVAVAALLLCLCLGVVGGLVGFLYFRSDNTATTDPAVIYVLDTSPRMQLEFENGTRLQAAQAVLAEVVRPADPTVKAGLRIFGSGTATGCVDTELLVPLAPATQPQIVDKVFGLTFSDSADSALTEAMLAAIKDLSAAQGPHTLVVITGGEDSCQAESGALIKQEVERAGIELQEFVIGLAVTAEESAAIKGLIDDSVGTYLDAPDTATLLNILQAIQAYIDQPATTSVASIQAAATPGAVVTIPTPTNDESEVITTPANAYQSQTACDHPYLPYRTDATWNETSSLGEIVWAAESVAGDLTQAVVTTSVNSGGFINTFTAECTSEGIGEYQKNTFTAEGTTYTVVVSNLSGFSLLPVEALVSGATWTSGYTEQTSGDVSGVAFVTTNDVSHVYTVGDKQSLTTSLGTFETLPITLIATSALTDSFGNASTSTCTTVTYYAYGIGSVQLEQDCGDSIYNSQLTSYSFP